MKKQHSKNSDLFDLAKPGLREFKDHCLTKKNFQECILEWKFLGQSLSTVRKYSHHHQKRLFTQATRYPNSRFEGDERPQR